MLAEKLWKEKPLNRKIWKFGLWLCCVQCRIERYWHPRLLLKRRPTSRLTHFAYWIVFKLVFNFFFNILCTGKLLYLGPMMFSMMMMLPHFEVSWVHILSYLISYNYNCLNLNLMYLGPTSSRYKSLHLKFIF